METRHYSYQGKSFRYADIGKGPTLIFVGGVFQSIDKLGPLSDYWKKYYRLVLIELPGFGQSDYLPPEYDCSFTSDCIRDFVDHFNLVDPVIVGTSYSTPSVYRFVAENQDMVKAMVLGGSSTQVDKLMEYQIRMMLWVIQSEKASMFPQTFAEVMCNSKSDNTPNLLRIHHILQRSLGRLQDEDKLKFVANSLRFMRAKTPDIKVRVPTLVFTGEHDKFTSAERLSEFAKYCWDLRIVRIEGADHLYHMEQTEKMLTLIDEFVGLNQHYPLPMTG
jgi:pimeloyl-ACP methyl ester carboxylesterase